MSKSFHGYERGPDFDRARSQIATPFQYVDIPLDVATSNAIFNISGDFLYSDASSTGVVVLELNNQYNDPSAPFLCQPGFGLEAIFKQVKLSWAAQAGKKLRLMYSTGDRVVPTNSTTINGTVETTNNGLVYTAAYKSTASVAANTPDTIFTPAANVNGAVILSIQAISASSAGFLSVYVAKSSAPVGISDGDVIATPSAVEFTGSFYAVTTSLNNPIKIPAGKGLYYISHDGESGVQLRSVLYKLL